MFTAYYNFWEDWLLYHKVTIDGKNKKIIVAAGVTNLDIKIDVYSAWKEWVRIRDNGKYPPAIRSVGGDSTVGDQKAGDIYFLINNWILEYNPSLVRIKGALFSDNYETAYRTEEGMEVFPATVSSLVVGRDPVVDNVNVTVEGSAPSVEEISDAIWNKQIAELLVAGSTGEKIKKLITLQQFLGLK